MLLETSKVCGRDQLIGLPIVFFLKKTIQKNEHGFFPEKITQEGANETTMATNCKSQNRIGGIMSKNDPNIRKQWFAI